MLGFRPLGSGPLGSGALGSGSGASAITGTLAATETTVDTAAFSGAIAINGTLAVTESGNDVLSSTGTTIIVATGSLSATESGNDVLSSTGTTIIVATFNTIAADIQQLSAGAIVSLYELDLTGLGDSIYYFHAGTNELQADVIWGGVTYLAFPIDASGFDISSNGEIPRPRLVVSNILGTIGSLVRSLDDLVGAKITRRRTFLKYLDAVNFTAGNPIADPNVEFDPDIYYIDRKVSENSSFIEFELSSSWDVQGVKLPRRQIIQNMCPWSYRSSECSYAGGAVADSSDNLTSDPALDSCSKSLKGCSLRFGENGILPFGGFPGAGLLDA